LGQIELLIAAALPVLYSLASMQLPQAFRKLFGEQTPQQAGSSAKVLRRPEVRWI